MSAGKTSDLVHRSRYVDGKGFIGLMHNIRADILRNKFVYLCIIPIAAFFIIFSYAPMGGVLIAFQEFNPRLGMWRSEWVGLDNFRTFFDSIFLARLFRNTLTLSFLDLLFGFPLPIIFALLLNEVRILKFKKAAQTISYMPYFISTVVLCGLAVSFTMSGGAVASFVGNLTGNPDVNLIGDPRYFRTIFVIMNLWQGFGYGSIIYLAALSNTDMELYEAAAIDGAGRWKQMIYITLPAIKNISIFALILRMASVLSVSTDKIILMYSPATFETADVLGTYIYRVGLLGGQYGLTAAVGLLNSVIGFTLLIIANHISRRFADFRLF